MFVFKFPRFLWRPDFELSERRCLIRQRPEEFLLLWIRMSKGLAPNEKEEESVKTLVLLVVILRCLFWLLDV